MIVLVVLPLALAPQVKPVERERNAVSQDRYLNKLHAMAELVWADCCREDER